MSPEVLDAVFFFFDDAADGCRVCDGRIKSTTLYICCTVERFQSGNYYNVAKSHSGLKISGKIVLRSSYTRHKSI